MLVWIDIDTTISKKKKQKWRIVTKYWIHVAGYQLCEYGLQQQIRILNLIFPTLMWYYNPGLLGWDGWPHWKEQHCYFDVEYLWITCSSHYGYFDSFFHPKNTSIELQYHSEMIPLDHRWCWAEGWKASGRGAGRWQSGCTSVLVGSGKENSRCGRCSGVESSGACIGPSPWDPAQYICTG